LKELISPSLRDGAFKIGFADDGVPGIEKAVFSAQHTSDMLTIAEKPAQLVFSWQSPQGVVVDKQLSFSPNSYLIGVKTVVRNLSDYPINDRPVLSLISYIQTEDSQYYSFEGPSYLMNSKLEQVKIKKLKGTHSESGTLRWISVESQYFLTSIIPAVVSEAAVQIIRNDRILNHRYIFDEVHIRPGDQKTFEFNLFLGPKEMKTLRELNNDLDRVVHFGMFDFLAKPCLWLMNFLYRYIPNYGVAIIILTILIKMLLWPLGNKSYKSMNEMKKIQPLIAEIKEKYKHDKKKMNEEFMNLYKVYKINPMGGCLPLLLQLPVFFALYRMLYEAIELRHAPFMLWINDLSAPDRLFDFGFSIPFMQAPYGIPVLTIIMGATMILQQKMSPPPGDPIQAKMMTFMPIVFTVIFINFSSGLVLYWLVNNVLSISQQYYISKKNK
jgi:YidC/Oxa1 family membrane protein insertase